MIMVTLTKLLEIRIVANKRSESFSRALIRLSEVCFPSSISLKSTGEREKKAFPKQTQSLRHTTIKQLIR